MRIIFVILFTMFGVFLSAQWSINSDNPNIISNQTGEQVIPKTAICSNGNIWFAWFSNINGNYDVYLQLYNSFGYTLWQQPLLVSNHTSDSWLTEWDMDCDASGNAVIVFQDIRLGTNNVVAYCISQEQVFIWGNDGIMLSQNVTTDVSNYSPVVCTKADGTSVVAWQQIVSTTAVKLQSISSSGQLLWGMEGITLANPNGSITWPQIIESGNNDILLKYYSDTGPLWAPTRYIYVNRINSSGNNVWTNPTPVQTLGGISAWQQLLSITTDLNGGMFITWYDDRNSINISSSYAQHINSEGLCTFSNNGSAVALQSNNHQFYPKLAFNNSEQALYVFWQRDDSNQNMHGISMQKFNMQGQQLWNSSGIDYIPQSAHSVSPISTYQMGNNIVLIHSYESIANSDQATHIKACLFSSDGLPVWHNPVLNIATTDISKYHFSSVQYNNIWGIIAWEQGTSNNDVYAMRVNLGGTIGVETVPAPINLTYQINQNNDVTLTWELVPSYILPMHFRIYRNNQMINEIPIDQLSFIYENLPAGNWTFYVTSVWEDGTESLPSNIVNIMIVSNNEEVVIQPNRLHIYPNPFNMNLYINSNNKTYDNDFQIEIFNLKGQLIRLLTNKDKIDGKIIWDGKDNKGKILPKGVYLVRSNKSKAVVKALKY